MFKDTPQGTTHFCTHATPNSSGICDKCLGRAEDVIGAEISGTQSRRMTEAEVTQSEFIKGKL